MKKTILVFLVVVALGVAFWVRRESIPRDYVVEWNGVSNPSTTTFKVDGENCGVGVEGLAAAIRYLSELPKDSEVNFAATGEEWGILAGKYVHDGPMPTEAFRAEGLGDFSEKFNQVMVERHLGAKRKSE